MLKHFTNCKIIHQVAAQVQNSIKLHNVQALAKGSYTTRSFGLKSRQLITQNGMIDWSLEGAIQHPKLPPVYCFTMLVFCRAVPEGQKIMLQTQNYQHLFKLGVPVPNLGGQLCQLNPRSYRDISPILTSLPYWRFRYQFYDILICISDR